MATRAALRIRKMPEIFDDSNVERVFSIGVISDVDEEANHDEEIEDVPDAPHIRVWGGEEPVGEDLDDELQHEGEPEPKCAAFSNVKPRFTDASVLCVMFAAIHSCGQRVDDDPLGDSDK
jgi:hypothetical protein